MQCAAGSTGEAGPVKEDACPVDKPGYSDAVGTFSRKVGSCRERFVLPLLGRQSGSEALHLSTISFVGEMGTVGTATLSQFGRVFAVYALATTPEDALPVTGEKGHVKGPGAALARVFEANEFV